MTTANNIVQSRTTQNRDRILGLACPVTEFDGQGCESVRRTIALANVINEQIGQYRITGRLGQGGMGEIFSARDEKLNRNVAVKVIISSRLDDDSSRRLFLREARAAAALDHPFICVVHDVLEHQGQPLIVMERVEGETLQARIVRGALSAEETIRCGAEIADALAAAHACGIVHRDIKTANIMLTAGGHVKIMDFGLALQTATAPDAQTAHRSEEMTSRMAGTLPYMAPEVLRGENATASADLYAFGVVMYEMLTSRRPFAGKTDAVLAADILERPPTPPRQVNSAIPRGLDDLIMRLLAKEPRKRPSAEEVRGELQAMAEPKRREQHQSLAVLPFRNLTPDDQNAHLGVALADATTSELALVRSLLVRPTAAILRYHDADPVTAAHDLGVDFVVAGTFQRAGARVRVSVQLISAAEERPLWSTKIDNTLDDLFAMQDDVSRKIVDALKLELTPADEERFAKKIHASGDLLELCLKGRVALLHETIEHVNEAIEFFERAQEIDPRNPLPWVGLSDAYSRLAFTYDPEGGWEERAREMCERALQLDPNVPEGRYIRGRLAWMPQAGFQHEYAIREIVAALAERPNLNEGFDRLATILWHVGLLDEAQPLYERALAIYPDDPFAARLIGTLEGIRGNYAASIAIELESASKSPESWGLHTLASSQIRMHDFTGAEKTIESGSRLFLSVALYDGLRSEIAALRGDAAAAQRWIDKAVQNRKAYGHFHHVEFDVACSLALLGKKDEALSWLRSCTQGGLPCLPAVENEPLLVSLHSESGYADLVRELRASLDHYRTVFESVRGDLSGR